MVSKSVAKANPETYKKVNTILVTQPEPTSPLIKNPFEDLEKRYGVKIDFRSFIHVEDVPEKEFRKNRIRLEEYNCVIFNSKIAIENFFRLSEEMRSKISPETKYFCITEAVANYLQKFILYRKRKVFVGTKSMQDLANYLNKHKHETFLVPMSNLGNKSITNYLDKAKIKYQDAEMYKTVSSDLSDLSDIKYDMLAFFSPQALQSVYDNFPDFSQDETRIAVYGKSTLLAAQSFGLTINVEAPHPDAPSMPGAIELYLQKSNK